MKKICLFIILMCVIITASAQSHFRFMGIPIDGRIEKFEDELSKRGFERVDRQEEIIVLKGEFTRRDVAVWVVGTILSYTTWKVAVKFKPTNSWFDLKNDYLKYVNLLTKKYGEPNYRYEKFIDYREGDGEEIRNVLMDRCRFCSFWELDGGVITTKISKFGYLEIDYEDTINTKVKEEEEDIDANLDI